MTKCAEKLDIKYKIGVIASGDQFIDSSDKKKELVKDFNAIAVEMEGASTGQVCNVNGIDFAVIRAISDGNENNSSVTYKKSKQSASDVSTAVIIEYLSM